MKIRFLSYPGTLIAILSALSAWDAHAEGPKLRLRADIDPLTRLVSVSYTMPATAPTVLLVTVEARQPTGREWSPARVQKLRSPTALAICPKEEWDRGMLHGVFEEYNAGGLVRTFVWYPFPDFERDGKVSAVLRVSLADGAKTIASGELSVEADNSDVITIENWGDVLQKDFISDKPEKGAARWWFNRTLQGEHAPVRERRLDVAEKGVLLPQLTWRLNLRGKYALFVCMPDTLSAIELRLSGDENTQLFSGRLFGQELFWKNAALDYQNIIIKQPYRTVHEYEDYYRARLDYIRLVPIPDELYDRMERRSLGPRDKVVLGYNEPYSWAFYENVQTTLQHREPLIDFRRAQVDIVDIQISRLGMRPVYETRNEEPLYWATLGDPVRGKVPETSNVGRIQQYTNTLETELRYARELGLLPFANLGAGNSYPGSPLQGEFSKAHPDWHNGAQMRYDIPEVQEHMLNFYKEALEIGAEGISIDFCRYPHGQTSAEVCSGFLRKLRNLADAYGEKRGKHIQISVRFPAKGVARWEWFDYMTWCRERLVDYLCPSNIQARHLNFDITPYAEAVRGTGIKLCPVVDALEWGLCWPGEFLQRVRELYGAGADGIYIYQCDSPAHDSEMSREMVRICGSTDALDRFFETDAQEILSRSKGIYLKPPTEGQKYNRWERVRIWVDGIVPGTLEVTLDGKVVNRFEKPPFWVGTEENESDTLLVGKHTLKIRARDGERWLEKTFEIEGE